MPLERIKIPVDVSALDVHNLQEYLHILAMLRYLDLKFPSALCGILIKLTPTAGENGILTCRQSFQFNI